MPEWYFLPFYAILRALPGKLLGVCGLLASLLVLLFLPFYDRGRVRSFYFRPLSKVLFWCFVVVCLLLGWVGGKPIEAPFLLISQLSTFLYFVYLLVIVPCLAEITYGLRSVQLIFN